MEIKDCSHFQHDGAPCHQTKAVPKWLEDTGIEVNGLWPGNSPDLNPIENCWNLLKTKVASNDPTPLKDLKEKIKTVWVSEISPEYCERLCTSMPRRIRDVLDKNGFHTKY